MTETAVAIKGVEDTYRRMWEDWGEEKKNIYLNYKFKPTHRVGLTNYVREQALLGCIKSWEGLEVLDVGCAAGNQLHAIQKEIKRGHGVDIAQSLVEAAREYAKKYNMHNLTFSREEVEQLSAGDNAFDVVICGEVLEHVFDKDTALKELLRVLKPGGHLLISVPNLNADGTWWGRLMRSLGFRSFTPIEVFSKEEIASHGDAHVREYTGQDIRNWLANHPVKFVKLTSASYIDGPGFDTLLRYALKITLFRNLCILLENKLSKTGVLWGRHLVFSIEK